MGDIEGNSDDADVDGGDDCGDCGDCDDCDDCGDCCEGDEEEGDAAVTICCTATALLSVLFRFFKGGCGDFTLSLEAADVLVVVEVLVAIGVVATGSSVSRAWRSMSAA